jgi:hypothetical protein
MRSATMRPAYSTWSSYSRQYRDIVAVLTDTQLAIRPALERWPIRVTIGQAVWD